MFFTSEKSRDSYLSPVDAVKKAFPDACGIIDAEYLTADRTRVLGISNLPMRAPIALALLGNEQILDLIAGSDENVLFVYGDKNLPEFVTKAVDKALSDAAAGAGYLNDKGEHVINLKGFKVGWHYNVNLLLGNRVGFENPMLTTPKSSVDALGHGAFRAGADTPILPSRYVYDPAESGEPANRQFYLAENNKQIFYSSDVNTNVKSAVCTHKPNHTVIEYETECGLKITRTIFIMPQYEGMADAVECQTVKIENLTDKNRQIKIVMIGQLGVIGPDAALNDIIYGSIVHESAVLSKDGKIYALSPNMHPRYAKHTRRFASMFVDGEPMDEYCANYDEFVGTGSLEHPANVVKLVNRPNRKAAAFFAMGKTLDIKAHGDIQINEFVGHTYHPDRCDELLDDNVKVLAEKYSSNEAVEKALCDVKKFYSDYSSYLKIKTSDKNLDAYINNNLPFQVLYQAFLSRSFAWTQKAFRQIGFREIQDMYPSLYYFSAMGNSELAKSMISEWVKNVYEYGYANHNFYWQGNGAGDCSDDQLWLIQAVYRYVKHTKDVGFIDEKYPIAGSDKTRSVFDTMMAAVEYSAKISVGKHGLPLLDHADWNDCLKLDDDSISAPEKLERYKKQLAEKNQPWGTPWENHLCESVMNAFLLKIAEDELCEMAKMTGRDEAAKELEELSAKLQDNIQKHAWKENFFARCLINNPDKGYTYVGSKGDGLSEDPAIDGSYYLNSFSWSILADSATEEQIAAMYEPLYNYIRTDAGLMLSSPCDLGKVSRTTASDHYFHGDRENGAVFKHATMMSTAAMFKAAKKVKSEELAKKLTDLAFWMLDLVYPFKTMDDPYVLKGNPRFCTQYKNSETNENIGPLLSGTASWLNLSVFEFLGIGYVENGLKFDPILPDKMTKAEYEIKRGGTTFAVTVTKPEGFARIGDGTKYLFDGKACADVIPDPADGKKHTVEIVL